VGYIRPCVSRTEIVLAAVRCGAQICLARRSQHVATSRGLWSVVTGYVEPNTHPTTQAWTEVLEELGLRAPELRLTRTLEPVPLTSPTSGKEFMVYPFLFECDSSTQLVLNWEHTDVQWVDPARLQEADCVSWQFPLVQALLQAD
jgi:ribose 1,5-bisphosphate isomerase